MNNTNEIFETLVESQKKTIEALVDTTSKIQEAFKSEKPIEKTTEVCQDWWITQLEMLNNISIVAATDESKDSSKNQSENFYKNMFEKQMESFKKASANNMSFFNSINHINKKSDESSDQYTNMYENWTTMVESWTKSLNNSYEKISKSFPTGFSKETLDLFFNSSTMNEKIQDVFKPFLNTIKMGDFSAENVKSMFDFSQINKMTEKTFNDFFKTEGMNSIILININALQDYFQNQEGTTKEFKEFWSLYVEKFPQIVSGDFGKMEELIENTTLSFRELFAPVLKLITNTKEKENIDLALEAIDKSSIYGAKLAKIQFLLYSTGQNIGSELNALMTEKVKEKEMNSFQNFFSLWVEINEKHYSELFATDEFSKLKSELLSISLEVKRNVELQFENRIEHLPLVVKSEMDEVYKTIHDLKKTIKDLESKLKESTIKTESINSVKNTSKKVTA
jgi:hypothetical protein